MRALGPAAAFRASLLLCRGRPFAAFALGLALYTSLASVCCGFGAIAAPWFACELLALLLSAGLGSPQARSRAWWWAGLTQMIGVVVLCSVASLALMSLGPEAALRGVGGGGALARLGHSLLVMTVAGAFVLSLTVYFEYAPAILIERGGGFTAALLESARLVSRNGPLRTWATSALAHGLPLAVALAAVSLLALRSTLASALGLALLLLPLLVGSLVIGQGMLVANYLHLRTQVSDPAHGSGPSKSGAAVWAALLSCVMLGPVAVSLALLKPAPPRAQPLPDGRSVLLVVAAQREPRELYVPGSALSLRVARGTVAVSASDGGGAGTLALPHEPVRAVRVVHGPPPADVGLPPARAESSFGIEVQLASGRVFSTWIDEAGVRLDDSLERRVALRLSPLAGLLLVLCFVWTAIWIARSLPPQARIHHTLSGRRPEGLDAEHERRLRVALRARALGAAVWLVPAALGSLSVGLSALLR